MSRILKALNGAFKGVGTDSRGLPTMPEETSGSLKTVRDVQDRRALKATGRTDLLSVRVKPESINAFHTLNGALTQSNGRKVTNGAALEYCIAAGEAMHKTGGKVADVPAHVWEGLAEIAAKEGMSLADALEDLVSEKLQGLGVAKVAKARAKAR